MMILLLILASDLFPPPITLFHTIHRLVLRFVDTYFSTFPGYYDTMDAGVKDEHGYIKVKTLVRVSLILSKNMKLLEIL